MKMMLVLGGELLELRPARRRAVLVQDLADHAGRREPGEPREVDGGLGMPDALEHAAVARAQRKHVARRGAGRPAPASGSTATRIVVARSCALMPVVTPKRGDASMLTVYAVR